MCASPLHSVHKASPPPSAFKEKDSTETHRFKTFCVSIHKEWRHHNLGPGQALMATFVLCNRISLLNKFVDLDLIKADNVQIGCLPTYFMLD